MSKYYLIARDRVSNDFQILSFNGKRGCTLEEIDIFTTGFQNEEELSDYFQKNGVGYENIDFFIASQNKSKGKTYLKKQELLYSNNIGIRGIATNSYNKEIEKSGEAIDLILDEFAERVRRNPVLFDQVITGKTNVYDKYCKYFAFSRYQPAGSIKYRDGAWARTSYPLVRNVLEAMSRKNRKYARMSDDMYRGLLDKQLIRATDPKFDENQLSIFDQFPEVIPGDDLDDKIVEVMTTIERLPRDVFVIQNDRTYFNQKLFSSYDEGDLEKFETYLPEQLRLTIQLFAIHRDYLESEPQQFGDAYQLPIRNGQRTMIQIFQNYPDVLEKTYLWCQLYEKYQDKALGDVNGRGVQKRKKD